MCTDSTCQTKFATFPSRSHSITVNKIPHWTPASLVRAEPNKAVIYCCCAIVGVLNTGTACCWRRVPIRRVSRLRRCWSDSVTNPPQPANCRVNNAPFHSLLGLYIQHWRRLMYLGRMVRCLEARRYAGGYFWFKKNQDQKTPQPCDSLSPFERFIAPHPSLRHQAFLTLPLCGCL